MRRRPAKQTREFFGSSPRNSDIADKIRSDGYVGVMFDQKEFIDAVIWAANVVYEYMDFFRDFSNRAVASVKELPYLREDLLNAHQIMIIYYKMKKDLVFSEEFKLSLYTIAIFQDMEQGHASVVKAVEDRMTENGDTPSALSLSSIGVDAPKIDGADAKKLYDHYVALAHSDSKKYKELAEKLPG
ncbi:hypothetical protein FACS1894167_15630 [Synergistales bacterium]|nr:hypothetical protein FACS1894167_15630 [Synergistales bacterium]